jgi:hypothetical protein
MKRKTPTPLDLYGTAICSAILLVVAIASASTPVILLASLFAAAFIASTFYEE